MLLHRVHQVINTKSLCSTPQPTNKSRQHGSPIKRRQCNASNQLHLLTNTQCYADKSKLLRNTNLATHCLTAASTHTRLTTNTDGGRDICLLLSHYTERCPKPESPSGQQACVVATHHTCTPTTLLPQDTAASFSDALLHSTYMCSSSVQRFDLKAPNKQTSTGQPRCSRDVETRVTMRLLINTTVRLLLPRPQG